MNIKSRLNGLDFLFYRHKELFSIFYTIYLQERSELCIIQLVPHKYADVAELADAHGSGPCE